MWMGWKPLSITAYLPELERGIWKQTNNHFWKRKTFILSASRGIYQSAIWDRVLSRLRDGLKPIHSFLIHPLPAFAVIETIITACQGRTWQPGGVWLRGADRVKQLPLHTVNQLRMRGATGEDTVKRDETVAGCCCSAGRHMRGCCTDMQHAQHNCSKIKIDPDNCAVFWFEHSYNYLLWNITGPISKEPKPNQPTNNPKVIKLKKKQV